MKKHRQYGQLFSGAYDPSSTPEASPYMSVHIADIVGKVKNPGILIQILTIHFRTGCNIRVIPVYIRSYPEGLVVISRMLPLLTRITSAVFTDSPFDTSRVPA